MRNKNKFLICHDLFGRKKKFLASKISFRPSVYGLFFRGDKILLCPPWNGYDILGIEKRIQGINRADS